jgi:hypothetical protein
MLFGILVTRYFSVCSTIQCRVAGTPIAAWGIYFSIQYYINNNVAINWIMITG